MHFLKNFAFWFVIILVTCNLLLMTFSLSNTFSESFTSPTSPIPKIISATLGRSTTFWEPNFSTKAVASEKLELTALSAISYDISTNTLIYEKNSDKRLPMASLTKIMTAVIALENLDLNAEVEVTPSAAKIGEGTMGLSEGEKLSVEELLYGLLLQSGNDAAETIAQTSKFGRARYLHLMNKKAEDLGLSNTRFTNPSGLEGDGEQYSTSKDLVVMTRYALKIPLFAKIVSTYNYDIPATKQHKEFNLFNETNLLTTYPGVKGVKTGYTYEAGYCLVTYLDYQGHQIIAVVMNSQNRREEMAELLDFSLRQLGITPPKRT